MKKDIRIYQYQRGNHSIEHVYQHGKELFRGTAMEARKELNRMKNFVRNEWCWANTNQRLKDYIAYEMSDIWVIDMTSGKPEHYYY